MCVFKLEVMQAVLVTSKIDLALECPRANVAGKWLEASMFATMGDEVRRLTEGLATLTTYERLLT